MGYLQGKTAIITGGGRALLSDGSCGSIGYGIATAYAKEGANLVLTGRNLQKLLDAKEELERLYGVKVLPVQADVSAGADNEAVVQNVVDQAIEAFGEAQPVATVPGQERHVVELTRLYATDEAIRDGIDFYKLTNFSLVICKPDRKIIYSDCQWSAIQETGKLGEMVLEKVTLVASRRIETGV